MATELRAIWVARDSGHRDPDEWLSEVAGMLDRGWELVSWQPIVTSYPEDDRHLDSAYATRYDAFLLRRTTPST